MRWVSEADLRLALRLAWAESGRRRVPAQTVNGLAKAAWHRLTDQRAAVPTLSDAQAVAFAADLLYYCGVRPGDVTVRVPPHEIAGGVRMVFQKYGVRSTAQTGP